jgi:hypothetical protein
MISSFVCWRFGRGCSFSSSSENDFSLPPWKVDMRAVFQAVNNASSRLRSIAFSRP